ncbi:glycosyltransferase [Halioglobus sp.]|nr:glycosyltransferase [Halioglobus sp.]
MSIDPTNQKFRIAIVVQGFPELTETFVSLQVAELVRRGHQVKVYAFGREGEWEWLPPDIGAEIGAIQTRHMRTEDGELKGKRFLYWKAAYLLLRRPKAMWAAWRGGALSQRGSKFALIISRAYLMRDLSKHDIIHCQFSTQALPVLKLRKLGFLNRKPKIFASVRGHDLTKNPDQNQWNRLLDGVDHFLPVCREFESRLSGMGCKKAISIVRAPVHVNYIQSVRVQDPPHREVRLVSIGRLIEKKGIVDALAAMSILDAEGVDFRYSIIGDGELRKSLVDSVRSQGLSDRVRFLGSLPSAETLPILGASHILIAPSKEAESGDSEGIPNALKEAMLMGLQAVSTRHSGIPELIQHEENGYLCAEGDPEGLARTIQEVLVNPEKWPCVAERAAQTVLAEYSPEKTTNDLIQAYRSTVTEGIR